MVKAKKVLKKFTSKSVETVSKKALKSDSKLVPKHIEMKGFLSLFILHELDGNSLSGDELARIVGGRKNTTLTPGTIYPALKRLRRQKLVQYRRNGRKKMYFLTIQGKSELKALYFVFNEFFSGFKKKMK
jgi:DNA-binding PadR family transcriptional regulator